MTGNITDENIALLEEKISQAEAILVYLVSGQCNSVFQLCYSWPQFVD